MKISYNSKLKSLSRVLRKNRSLFEALLWNQLKARKILGYQFTRQKPIGNYIVDFYCNKLKLAIEVDGDSHLGKYKHDDFRQSQIEKAGVSFLRFNNSDVKKNMDGVVNQIHSWIKEHR